MLIFGIVSNIGGRGRGRRMRREGVKILLFSHFFLEYLEEEFQENIIGKEPSKNWKTALRSR